jgi:GNAT superfamily N-acetyltransferase
MTADNHDIVITRPARDDEAETLANVLESAFCDLPPTRWLLPDPDERCIRFSAYARIWVDHGLATGTVEVAETDGGDLAGLTIWWREPAGEPTCYAERLAYAVGPKHMSRFEIFDQALQAAHPKREHLYLAFAAVDPFYQRCGYGTALLDRRHIDLDACKVPAYLVAASAQARELYLRHGYRDFGTTAIDLPSGPRMYPMWRHPITDGRCVEERPRDGEESQ